jgi:hypothetical protein
MNEFRSSIRRSAATRHSPHQGPASECPISVPAGCLHAISLRHDAPVGIEMRWTRGPPTHRGCGLAWGLLPSAPYFDRTAVVGRK